MEHKIEIEKPTRESLPIRVSVPESSSVSPATMSSLSSSEDSSSNSPVDTTNSQLSSWGISQQSKKKITPLIEKHIKLELWVQQYTDKGIPESTMIVKSKNYEDFIPVHKERLIIYMPICFENYAYEAPNFERLLSGIVSRFKDKKVHFAFLVTDELNRHNWAKKATKTSQKTVSGGEPGTPDDSSESKHSNDVSPRRPKCLYRNRSFIKNAQKESEEWLRAVKMDSASIDETTKRIGCEQITVFFWSEFKKATNLRELFCVRMNLTENTKELPFDRAPLDLEAFGKFVESERKNDQRAGENFNRIIEGLLRERAEKDFRIYGDQGARARRTCNDAYLTEEEIVQARVFWEIGDCFDFYIQPEQQVKEKGRDKRTRISPSLEWHDWWARKLLEMFTGKIGLLNHPKCYKFMSVAYSSKYIVKSAPEPGENKRVDDEFSDEFQEATEIPFGGEKVKRDSKVMVVVDPATGQKLSPNSSPGKKPKNSVDRAIAQKANGDLNNLPTRDKHAGPSVSPVVQRNHSGESTIVAVSHTVALSPTSGVSEPHQGMQGQVSISPPDDASNNNQQGDADKLQFRKYQLAFSISKSIAKVRKYGMPDETAKVLEEAKELAEALPMMDLPALEVIRAQFEAAQEPVDKLGGKFK